MSSDNSTVSLDTSLIAKSSAEEGFEETAIPLILQGNDTSGMKRDLFFKIMSVPRNGILFEPKSEYMLSKGDTLNQVDSYPWSGVQLIYKGRQDFFTSPHEQDLLDEAQENSNHESFEFAIMTTINDLNNTFSNKSSPAQYNITVVNVNDPLIMDVPSKLQSIYKFSALNWKTDECKDNAQNLPDTCVKNNVMRGISTSDPDEGIDFVRVDVRTTNGILSIHKDELPIAEFASCSQRNTTVSKWNCLGSGTGDREMIFITKPHHLTPLFSSMTYESLNEGYDNITLSIYDGVGGDCLSISDHMTKYNLYNVKGPYTVHNFTQSNSSCHQLMKTVPVYVTKKGIETKKNGVFHEFPMQLWVASIALLSSFLIVSVFTFCTQKQNGRKAPNKSKIKQRSKKRKRVNVTKRSLSTKKAKETAAETQIQHAHSVIEESHHENHYNNENSDVVHDEHRQMEHDYISDNCDDEDYEWIQYYDSTSGDNYYQNTRTRRVSWTKPDGPFIDYG